MRVSALSACAVSGTIYQSNKAQNLPDFPIPPLKTCRLSCDSVCQSMPRSMVLGGHIWGHGLVKWGHQGHLGNASQPVEVVMVTAQLVAMRCTWCDRAGHQVTPGYRASASM